MEWFDCTEPPEEQVKQVRVLVRENILPRLTELEEQVRLLRKVTWPVCQRLTEKGPLSDIESKREFLRFLDDDEVWALLKAKAQGRSLVTAEYDRIKNK
jgi:hypothetical protein